MSAEPRMMTAQEAALYCGFKSVNGFLAHVKVTPVNFGRCVRYDRKALDTYLDGRSQSPVSKGSGFADAAGQNSAH